MLNRHRPQPGRLDRSQCPGAAPRLTLNTDAQRGPVTFGWMLYAQDRFTGCYHLETLYRLDRIEHAQLEQPLLQDADRHLHRWLAGRVDSLTHAREAARDIALERPQVDGSDLRPSEYHDCTVEQLRQMLRAQQDHLLPPAPCGYRWIGPQLIEEVPCSMGQPESGLNAAAALMAAPPVQPQARLEFARELARKILCERVPA